MSVLTTSATDSAAFSARSPTHDSEKKNEKPIHVCEHCKKQWHTKDQCWKLHGHPLGGKKQSPNDKQNLGRVYVSESTSTSQPSGPTVNQNSPPSSLRAIAQSVMS